MMNREAIDLHIQQLPFTEAFDAYDDVTQTKIIMASTDDLVDAFDESIITEKMVALQAVYVAEGQTDEHAKFKLHGVKTMRIEDIHFTYDGGLISPKVVAMIEKILNPPTGAAMPPLFGRLI